MNRSLLFNVRFDVMCMHTPFKYRRTYDGSRELTRILLGDLAGWHKEPQPSPSPSPTKVRAAVNTLRCFPHLSTYNHFRTLTP